jgi:hypothetical protein
MKFPKQVTIGGTKIKVVLSDLMDDFGTFNSEKLVIKLRKGTYTEMYETLRHELVHASLFVSGVSFSERYDEEVIVRCLENLFWPCWEKLEKTLRPCRTTKQ